MMFVLFCLFAMVFVCSATSPPEEKLPCIMPAIGLPPGCHFKDEVGPNGCPSFEIECPPPLECSENEQVNGCGNACERHCGDPDPKMCNRMCGPPICVCNEKDGYVRNADGCVKEEECPAAEANESEEALV